MTKGMAKITMALLQCTDTVLHINSAISIIKYFTGAPYGKNHYKRQLYEIMTKARK